MTEAELFCAEFLMGCERVELTETERFKDDPQFAELMRKKSRREPDRFPFS